MYVLYVYIFLDFLDYDIYLKDIIYYRDNQRRRGLYHEIIYEAEVVYQINDRGAAEVSLSDERPKLNRLFHDKDRLSSDYPY